MSRSLRFITAVITGLFVASCSGPTPVPIDETTASLERAFGAPPSADGDLGAASPASSQGRCPSGSNIPSFSASATTIQSGAPVTLWWSGPVGGACTAAASPSNVQWSASLPASGNRTIVDLAASTIFEVSCGGPMAGGGCQQVTVVVPGTPMPTPPPTP